MLNKGIFASKVGFLPYLHLSRRPHDGRILPCVQFLYVTVKFQLQESLNKAQLEVHVLVGVAPHRASWAL